VSILDAAAEVTSYLDEQRVPYAVIGGMAVQYWGEARQTGDVDIVVLVRPDETANFLETAVQRFRPRIDDAVGFALANRVLLIYGSSGTPVDISLGIPGYEEDAVGRAVSIDLPGGRAIRIISAEDLIIHKCIAGRPRDIEDVELVLVRQRLSVDHDYIAQWLQRFQEIVEDRDVTGVYDSALQQATSALTGEDM
jgi:predicted nucleotidyltransferase